jgi:hypothetical protein
MARFYFDFYDGQQTAPDEEGTELFGIADALSSAREMLVEMIDPAAPSDIAVFIRGSSARLAVVRLSMREDILSRSPI